MIRAEPRSPGARAPGPGRTGLYALGAYVAYPLLALAGGVLLARADGPAGLAAAASLLAGALALPAWLATYCRSCGERPLPRLLRLLLLPAAVCTALAFRAATGPEQFIAFGLVGASAVMFGIGWRLSARRSATRGQPAPR